jgi:hypothetical protein
MTTANPLITPPTRIAIPPAKLVSIHKQYLNATLATILATRQKLLSDVWANPDGYTSQQVFDAYGVNAGWLVTMSGSLEAMLGQIDPTAAAHTPFTPPLPLTINADGTVTVGANS